MTSAIGKAATKATTIVEVNALSKFSSWRILASVRPNWAAHKRNRRKPPKRAKKGQVSRHDKNPTTIKARSRNYCVSRPANSFPSLSTNSAR